MNRVLIKDKNKVLKYLCLNYNFSFIDQKDDLILQNGGYDVSLFFKDSLHLTE